MLTPYCCPWKMSQSSICHNNNSAPSVLNPVHPGLHSRATSNSIGESYCAHLHASRMGLQSHFRVHWWVLLCSTLCIQAGTAEPFQSPLMSPTVLNSVHPGWDCRAISESFDESYCAQLCASRLGLQSHFRVLWWVLLCSTQLCASRLGLQSHFRVHWWVLLCSTLCMQTETAEPSQSPVMSPQHNHWKYKWWEVL